MATPDKEIPQELIEEAHCIVILPGLKTRAVIFGGKHRKCYPSLHVVRSRGKFEEHLRFAVC